MNEEIDQAVDELWTRAESHLFSRLGRQPTQAEIAMRVFNAQLMTLVVMALPDAEQRLRWAQTSICAMLGGNLPGEAS